MADASSDDDVVLLDVTRSTTTTRTLQSEWAFLDSPSSSNGNSEQGDGDDDSDFERRVKKPRRTPTKKKATTKRKATSTARRRRGESSADEEVDDQEEDTLPRRARHRHVFSDVMSLSELQAQEREFKRIQRLVGKPQSATATPPPTKKKTTTTPPRSRETATTAPRFSGGPRLLTDRHPLVLPSPSTSRANGPVVPPSAPVTRPRGRPTKRRLVESDEDEDDDRELEDEEEEPLVVVSPLPKKTTRSSRTAPSTPPPVSSSRVCKKTAPMPPPPRTAKSAKSAKKQTPPPRVKRPDPPTPPPSPPAARSRRTTTTLTDWLSVSELQAQEREWARLQRDQKLMASMTTSSSPAAASTKNRTQSSRSRSDSAASLISIVELMDDDEDDDDNNKKKSLSHEKQDDDEFDEEEEDHDGTQDRSDEDFEPSKRSGKKNPSRKAAPKGKQAKANGGTARSIRTPTPVIPSLFMPIAGTKPEGAEFAAVADTLAKPRTAAESVPHSTTWRAHIFNEAPVSLLSLPLSANQPFQSLADRPLPDYDPTGELEPKCRIVPSFGKAKQFLLTADTSTAELDQDAVNDRVSNLLALWSPRIRECFERKTDAIVREGRGRVAVYLDALDEHRLRLFQRRRESPRLHRDAGVCPTDRAIARELMCSTTLSPLDKKNRLGFTIGRGESFLSERAIVADRAIMLATVRPLSRSTTYIGVKSSVRVEDDPILRYVPYFGDNDRGDAIDVKAYESIRAKDNKSTGGSAGSSALDHEAHEYMLRLIVAQCGDAEPVFTALKQLAAFTQPYTEYGEIKKMHDARRLAAKRIDEVRSFLDSAASQRSGRDVSASRQAIDKLMSGRLRGDAKQLTLAERLAAPATYFATNLLPSSTADVAGETTPMAPARRSPLLGLRNTNDYSDLSETFRDLFCRMCYKYDCHEHGIEHPMPSRRVDPLYPRTRYAPVVLAAGAQKQNEKVEDEVIGVPKESVEKYVPSGENGVGAVEVMETEQSVDELEQDDESVVTIVSQELDGVDDSLASGGVQRRSVRSQTRASTLATLSLESQLVTQGIKPRQSRPRQRNVTTAAARPNGEESEYLDDSHVEYVSSKVKKFLSDDGICGDGCWKMTASDAEANAEEPEKDPFDEPEDLIRAKLTAPEQLVLQKLRYTVGDNACMISSVLESLSCRDVQSYLMSQQRGKPTDQDDTCFSPDVSAKKTRKRGRGNVAVQMNNRELLKRTRHQRLKDTNGANHEYEPCNHEGVCDFTTGCTCMKRDHMCEKACSCSRDCPNRFQGCRCSMGNCRTIQCPCFVAMRECNPDLCNACGASDMPVLVYNKELNRLSALDLGICCNVNVQRGIHKKVGVSFSTTHGWGAFALEAIKKGEFIYEYTGAIVSHDEAERRGTIYDKTAISFLFDQNEDAVVDAIRSGNKIKFSNHAAVGQKCHARIMRIGGEHRISIWAAADILKGEELFFNYGYHGESAPVWSQRITGASRHDDDHEDNKPSNFKQVK